MNLGFEVVGHRGWPARFPDNTLSGFLAAAAVADAVESDIRRCGDGRLVLSHDPQIDGMDVASTPWSTLAELDLGDGHHPALLDEVLASIPDTPMQMEIKNMPYEPGFENDHRQGLEAAERARPGDVITSFNWSTLDTVKAHYPEVTTGLCMAAFADVGEAVSHCLRMGHSVLVPWVDIAQPEMARAVGAGLAVYPWVVNDPDTAMELAGVGVAGIITDDPVTLVDISRGKK
jgi:glycerophosphoryl diester phosphodiesterase